MALDLNSINAAAKVNYEAALIWQIVEHKCMREVIRLKIDHTFLQGPQERAAFIYLRSYYDNPEYNDTPSIETFNANFPTFPRVQLDETLRAVCDQIRSDILFMDIAEKLQAVVGTAGIDPGKALEMLRVAGNDLYSKHHVDQSTSIRSSIDEIKEQYKRMKDNPSGLKGWAFPWNALNKATLGAQKGQLGVIYARPKRKKTWGAISICTGFTRQHAPGIIFSQELSKKEMNERFVAMATGVNFSKFLRGTLPAQQEAEFFEDLGIFDELPNVQIDRVIGSGEEGVSELFAKVEEHGASWFLLDGAYKLADDWKELLKVTKALKNGCLGAYEGEGVFGLLTSQAHKPRGKSGNEGSGDDMAFGDAFFVDCDWGLHLSTDIEDLQARRLTATLAFIRNGLGAKFQVKTRLCEDMSQTAELTFDEGNSEDGEEADKEADQMVEQVSADFANPDGQLEH